LIVDLKLCNRTFEGNSLVTPSPVTDSSDSQITTTLKTGEPVYTAETSLGDQAVVFWYSRQDLSAVNVHDSEIYAGDAWNAEDNFDNATAADGTALDYAGFIAAGGLVDDSKLDTNTPGTYPVTYTLNGVTATANITVKENKAEVTVHNSTIYAGDNWTAQDNFDSALDKDGNPVDFSQVTVDVSQADTSKAGTFDVTYTYDGVTSTATVTVLDKAYPKPTPEIPKDDDKNTDLPKASSSDSSSTSEKYVAHENNNKVSEYKSRKALPQTGSSNGVYLTLIGLAVLVGIGLTLSLKNKPRRK